MEEDAHAHLHQGRILHPKGGKSPGRIGNIHRAGAYEEAVLPHALRHPLHEVHVDEPERRERPGKRRDLVAVEKVDEAPGARAVHEGHQEGLVPEVELCEGPDQHHELLRGSGRGPGSGGTET